MPEKELPKNNTTTVTTGDEKRTKDEIAKISLKERAERAVASAALIHNLEYKQRSGRALNQAEIDVMARLNRELDVIMSDTQTRKWFEDEVKRMGSPVIWQPG